MTKWTDIAGPLLKSGAPILGTILGGPIGGAMGGAIGELLGGALGVPATPDAVGDALKNTPAGDLQAKLAAAEAEAAAKWPALAEAAKAEAEAGSKTAAEIGETMRAELLATDPMQRWWRPFYAFELTLECALVWPAIIYDVLFAKGALATFVIQASGLLMTYWAFRFGVLGVYTYGRTVEKKEEIKSSPSLTPDFINQIVKALKKK